MNFVDTNKFFLLEEIVKRNFSAKYKDSVLGILWSVLKPLFVMMILTIVFSTIFDGVDNYPVYLLSGRCIYDFFVGSIGVSMLSIKGNANILVKTPAPKYIFVLGSVISEFLNFIISLILLFCIMFITNAPFHFTIPLLIIPVIPLVLMITGISLTLSILCVYYTDVHHLWGVVALMLMYSSAIFYPMDIIPMAYRKILMLNPEYWIIDQFRCLVVYGKFPNMMNIVNSVLISLIIFVFGVIVFKKYQKKTLMKL